jgi:hypothetical protein
MALKEGVSSEKTKNDNSKTEGKKCFGGRANGVGGRKKIRAPREKKWCAVEFQFPCYFVCCNMQHVVSCARITYKPHDYAFSHPLILLENTLSLPLRAVEFPCSSVFCNLQHVVMHELHVIIDQHGRRRDDQWMLQGNRLQMSGIPKSRYSWLLLM